MTGHHATPHPPLPEFSRPVRVDDLAPGETDIRLEASAEEREALARRFELLSMESLTARVALMPEAGGLVRLTGTLRARLTQACVVTLAPVEAEVEASFERLYAPPTLERDLPEEEELGEDDPPDPIENGAIDLGEAVAEQLGLEIDPFPRAPGVEFAGYSSDGQGETAKPASPFAVLAKLKDRQH
jgi:uncharacterized metal-binding protein YceD (DUF177 family)